MVRRVSGGGETGGSAEVVPIRPGRNDLSPFLGFLAEAANHHPDLDIRWRTVAVALSTHDAGGLTGLDLSMAASIDEAAG